MCAPWANANRFLYNCMDFQKSQNVSGSVPVQFPGPEGVVQAFVLKESADLESGLFAV